MGYGSTYVRKHNKIWMPHEKDKDGTKAKQLLRNIQEQEKQGGRKNILKKKI